MPAFFFFERVITRVVCLLLDISPPNSGNSISICVFKYAVWASLNVMLPGKWASINWILAVLSCDTWLSGCITTDRIAMRVSHTKTAVLGIDDLTVFVEVSQYEWLDTGNMAILLSLEIIHLSGYLVRFVPWFEANTRLIGRVANDFHTTNKLLLSSNYLIWIGVGGMGSKFMGLSRPHFPLNKGCPLRVFFSIAVMMISPLGRL